ncbi:hypothetical protein QYF61_005583 [Mycteria americana]|uniref:Uncharacterized protein n=1 Tax=Mycteria americana TaxID=33587 RepID=A0AAN7MJ84_MYCAM|nr:hypothetical protein QYF61_005583 [Mycteria americana]
MDICSTVDLHGLQRDNLPHHGLYHRLQGNLCFGAWSTSSPSFFTDLASYAVLDAPQDTVGPFGCQGTLLTHIQLAINLDPQISFRGAALQPLVLQFVCIIRITSSQAIPSQCRIWHLLLLNFIWLVITQLSSLSRSLCKASLPSRESTAPPSLVSSANLLNVHSTPATRSFIKTLKEHWP